MNPMHELVTVEVFSRVFTAACYLWFAACWIVALVVGRRGSRPAMRPWVIASMAAPVAFILWRFHLWMVRVEPETGYVGLHKVSVFALNALVFVACGCLIGHLVGRLHNHGGKSEG